MLPLLLLLLSLQGEIVEVRTDNTLIDRSCTVVIESYRIVDEDGNGVIHVEGDGITVDFGSTLLRGETDLVDPDAYRGTAISIRGRDVTLRGARISGYKVGIHATGADGLLLEHCSVDDAFRQRLGSTIQAEDPADWLWPHENDQGQWVESYGASFHVERSDHVTIRRCRARKAQNGLVLDRVTHAKVYDNDLSFLSGWGLAMWRSSDNVVSRNALDFCVRGYSHGVYNRGQDSAGLLMFEQCSNNVIAENSVTHCGDGVFAFAGKEALGENGPTDPGLHVRRGDNDNLFIKNDLSDAVAHGLELTFSFGNRIIANRLVGNAICGIWGGYSRETFIAGNQIEYNGDRGYGLERGGINIEHGQRNWIQDNDFRENLCGVHLWSDEDAHLKDLPWMNDNGFESTSNVVYANHFVLDQVGIQLRSSGLTLLADNEMEGVRVELDATEDSEPNELKADERTDWGPPDYPVYGDTRPVESRKELRGRQYILVTEWGPYDWAHPLIWPVTVTGARHVYRILGDPAIRGEVDAPVTVRVRLEGERVPILTVEPKRPGITPYRVELNANDLPLAVEGVLVDASWTVRFFAWKTDPREDADAWRAEAESAVAFTTPALDFPFGGGGPGDVTGDVAGASAAADVPPDQFGTIAETDLRFPAGRWRLATLSDDGIRVWADGELLVDDWTWHGTTEHDAVLDLPAERTVHLRVEHFELDGAAQLSLAIRQAAD